MKCAQATLLIQQALDGRLSPDERRQLDAHLFRCPACEEAWIEYRRVTRSASAWARPTPADDPGEDFTARVLSQIALEERAPTSAGRLRLAWGTLVTLCLVALSVGAGPWAASHLPLPSAILPTPTLPSPNTVIDAWRLVPQDIHAVLISATATLPTVPKDLWAGLTAVAALNGLFVLRALRGGPSRESSAQ